MIKKLKITCFLVKKKKDELNLHDSRGQDKYTFDCIPTKVLR